MANAARCLGTTVRVVAQAGGHTGKAVRTLAERDRLDVEFVSSSANTRQCLCVLDESNDVVTEFYEPVADGTLADDVRIVDAVGRHLESMGTGDFLAISGRVAHGCSRGLVAHLVRLGIRRGVHVVVDSVGEPLRQAVDAGPSIVKVNHDEALTALDEPVSGPAPSPADCARQLADRSGGLAIVTAGALGAWAADGGQLLHLAAARPATAFTVGSGDTFVAGIVAGMRRRGLSDPSPEAALIDGTAASRVNLRNLVAGRVDPAAWETERSMLARDDAKPVQVTSSSMN